MNIVYFSHVGNTERFVENHLLPVLRRRPVILPEEEGEALRRGPITTRLLGSGPHGSSCGVETKRGLPIAGEAVIVVFPAYPRQDHESGGLVDTVPAPVKRFLELQKPFRVTGAVVCGNRTFGAKFGFVDPVELGDIPVLGRVEMSGTEREAEEIREALLSLAVDSDRKIFVK